MTAALAYQAFLEAKAVSAPVRGFAVNDNVISPVLMGHQAAMTRWMCAGGCRALFASFGLGKTMVQLVVVQIMRRFAASQRPDRRALALIVLPLGVRQEFIRDAAKLGIRVKFIRSAMEFEADDDLIYLTNYETIREGLLDPRLFAVASLDEASCLRGFGGSKTFREFMRLFEAVPFRFVATATPSPNEYIELLAYSAFLGVMDVGQAKTRFFKRNSEKADELTLHPHKEAEFWLWVASWGLFVQRPSDLGFSDEGYDLPPLDVRWHEVSPGGDETSAEGEQLTMFGKAALGLVEAAREKRDSLPVRLAKLMEIRAEDPRAHRIIWHDLEAERLAIEAAIPSAVTICGSQHPNDVAASVIAFSDGWFQELAAKPVMAGSGCNFQRHCWWAVFLGIGFKFNDFIQAIHRIQRFQQQHACRVDLIYSAAERPVRELLEAKWKRHEEQAAIMSQIIRTHGLSDAAMSQLLKRSIGCERIEVRDASGRDLYQLVNNDCVLELQTWAPNSVDLIVTSIPFSTQYEYTPSYNDFGHTDDNAHFWAQMDFLIGELFRVLQPGRNACIHVKDRVVPGGMTGLGFQTIYPFADDCRRSFMRAGFAYIGEKTNLTDVVRENAQTYRLGWSEQLKDGSRMGCGVPEKVLLFRKPPSDQSNGYADRPVTKGRPQWSTDDGEPCDYNPTQGHHPVPGTGYSRSRWQLDAHHLMRADGDRLLNPDEWVTWQNLDEVYRLWRKFNLSAVYDFEHHVRVGENLDVTGKLPPTFMLLPPHSWHGEVWTDIAQMLSMNTLQANKGAEKHLCPMPFMIADRLINQFSMPGETVLDPFAGLMTVPFRAVKAGRRGVGVELNPGYFLDGCKYVEAQAQAMAVPTLFDVLDACEAAPEVEAA